MCPKPEPRPHTTLVLAMSADGKIAPASGAAARFSSPRDLAHLEAQVARADGVLIGAGTLRAYGTTLSVRSPDLRRDRQDRGQPPQPVQIACSGSGHLDLGWRFFQQPVPRWLLTTQAGAERWPDQGSESSPFERLLIHGQDQIQWPAALADLQRLGLRSLAVLGGGILAAGLLAAGLIDEIWLTVCPLLLGGQQAPTPVAGLGFEPDQAPRLTLLAVQPWDQEVLLHYRVNNLELPPPAPPSTEALS